MNFFAVFLIIGAGTFQLWNSTPHPHHTRCPPGLKSLTSFALPLVSPKSVLLVVVVGGLSFGIQHPAKATPASTSFVLAASEMESRETGGVSLRETGHGERAGGHED